MRNKEKKPAHSAGFTMIELLVVMSVIGLLAFAGVKNIRDAQAKAALDDVKSAVVRSLETARNRAANGVGTEKHGVYLEKDGVTVFEGETYSGNGNKYVFHHTIHSDAAGEEVIFNRISGHASSDVAITISDTRGREETIKITADGSVTSE